jgi:hypothetical protein
MNLCERKAVCPRQFCLCEICVFIVLSPASAPTKYETNSPCEFSRDPLNIMYSRDSMNKNRDLSSSSSNSFIYESC